MFQKTYSSKFLIMKEPSSPQKLTNTMTLGERGSTWRREKKTQQVNNINVLTSIAHNIIVNDVKWSKIKKESTKRKLTMAVWSNLIHKTEDKLNVNGKQQQNREKRRGILLVFKISRAHTIAIAVFIKFVLHKSTLRGLERV